LTAGDLDDESAGGEVAGFGDPAPFVRDVAGVAVMAGALAGLEDHRSACGDRGTANRPVMSNCEL
jgi:hypothetical protein